LKYPFRPRPKVQIVRELPPGQPLVSVIIPTYNRGNVLRIAIQSVLWQTEQNFELLVMGDGCTDDSESVVNSFGDARIQWHNLPSNSGHQSAPVNAGLALSRGRYIAFLGHDDIWHPDHLRTQLRAIASANAGVSLAVIEMRGPRNSNYRVLSNIFAGGVYNPVKCSPPSGFMISREVYERVGPWNDYRAIWRNPECEFQYQAHLAGFQFVSTGELTVYKFTSVFRRHLPRIRRVGPYRTIETFEVWNKKQ
jgi:glycosyltransferase involved in cell wall biosynthesis